VRECKEHAVGSGASSRYESGTLADTQLEAIGKSATRICRFCHATGAENRRVHEETVEEGVNPAFRHDRGSRLDLDLAQHCEFSVFIGSGDKQLSLTNQLQGEQVNVWSVTHKDHG